MHTRILAFATLAALATASAAQARVWKQHYEVARRPQVRVVADDARVRIETVAGAKAIDILVVYDLKKWGMVFGSGEPRVTFERVGDVISVTVRDPRDVIMLGGVAEHLDVLVRMPVESELSVRTGDGAVDCQPVHGTVRIETGDGRITARALKGDVILMSGDGRILAEALDGKLRAVSGDGRMAVSGRFDALDLRTQDGRIEATAARGSKLAQPWTLESGDGSMTLRIPIDLKAFLDLHTNDGTIRVDLPIQTRGALRTHDLKGDLNGGGPVLRMRTGDGALNLGLAP